jgi:hypothetical protein
VARYDKFDSKLSGPRGFLGADWSSSNLNKVMGVGLNASGQYVVGAGNTGIIGILILTRVIKAGREPVDPMKRGEVVDFDNVGKPSVPYATATAGTRYCVDNTTGVVEALAGATAPAAGKTYIGHTVEKGRLIVNVGEK